jgi:hypothetical protein
MNSIALKEKLIIIRIIVSFVKDSYAQVILKSTKTKKKFLKIKDSRSFSFALFRHLEDNKINCPSIREYILKSDEINYR